MNTICENHVHSAVHVRLVTFTKLDNIRRHFSKVQS